MKKITQYLPGGSLSAYYILLLLLLIVPFLIYKYVSKGTNNFVKLAVIGLNDDHHIPEFTFLNQNNDTITNADYDDYIYIVDFFFTR